MTSIFFRISTYDFIEASKTYGQGQEYGVRIISFRHGVPVYVYLPEMSVSSLSLLVVILKAPLMENVWHINDLLKPSVQMIYY